MRTRIDYLADKYCFTERNESPRLRRQWQDVLEECRQTEAGPEERLRIALLNVDYVTSFELPFRLLLTRTPQLIAALREEWGISQKNVVFNDKRFGCVYSLKASLSGVRIHSGIICLTVFAGWLGMKYIIALAADCPGSESAP